MTQLKKEIEFEESYPPGKQFDDLFYNIDDGSWHIGQSYEEKTVDSIKCKICGSDKFNVGIGDHYTAIRCNNCKIEYCIHQG